MAKRGAKEEVLRRTRDSLSRIEDEAAQKAAGDMAKVQFDPVKISEQILEFCQVMTGTRLFPYQIPFGYAVIESLVRNDGEEYTSLFSRQSGKTETIAVVSAGCMVILPKLAQFFPKELGLYKKGLWIGVFAPTGEQASTTYNRAASKLRSDEALEVFEDPEIDEKAKSAGGLISITNGSFMRMMSAAKQAQIESKTYHLIIVEEAQDVDSFKMKKSISPMGAFTNATQVKIGTANNVKSDFYEAIQRNKRLELKHGGKKKHFLNDYRVVCKYNPRYAKYIEREKERLGEDSDEFRMAYGCEFILERGMFMTEERFDSMCSLEARLMESMTEGYQTAGIDIGKRNDSTVVTVVDVDRSTPHDIGGQVEYPKRIVGWLELQGDDHEAQFYQICEFLDKYQGLQAIYVDATGAGDPVCDRFISHYMGRVTVLPFVYSTPNKSKMYKYLQQEMLGGRLVIPGHSRDKRARQWRRFKQQCIDLLKTYSGQYLVVGHPPEKDAHDDYPDSWAQAVLAAKDEMAPEIEVEDNTFYDPRRDRAKVLKEAIAVGRRGL